MCLECAGKYTQGNCENTTTSTIIIFEYFVTENLVLPAQA